MSNFREVNDDILRDWLSFREKTIFGRLTEKDKKHHIYFYKICEKILKNIHKQNQKFIKKQLDKLNKNYMDYLCYWNEKYYMNRFCNGIQIIYNSLGK